MVAFHVAPGLVRLSNNMQDKKPSTETRETNYNREREGGGAAVLFAEEVNERERESKHQRV